MLAAWQAELARRTPPGSGRLRPLLPDMLDELARELEQPPSASDSLRRYSATLYARRLALGPELPQLVQEYELLRRTILTHAEANALAPVGDARRIVDGFIDEGIESAVQAYIECRDAAEKERRNEYLQFIVHDLRSPLSAIYYAIVLAERELGQTGAGERVRAIHDAIKRNIERMRGLIVKLLQEERNLATPANLDIVRSRIELARLVDGVVGTLGSLAAGADVELVNEIPADIVFDGDPDLLERALQNLITNAIEHSPKGRVHVGALRREGAVECWVQDSGRGMPPELIERAFAQTGAPRRGTELGLAVARRVVVAHGGDIEIETAPGEGSTVRFTLPAT
ncbi:MAG TPA: HAMP domain-containing sensor histidine kinase [Burkholderiales bacterium]